MLMYMIRKLVWQYRIYACEVMDKYYQKKAIKMALRKEKVQAKYAKFKKRNKAEYHKLMRCIRN